MGRAARSLAAVFFALVLAVGIAVFASHKQARALYVPDDNYILQNVAEDTRSSDLVKAARAQRVLTNAGREALPNLNKHLVSKAGLAGVGAGVWIHNGMAIYNATQCGQSECPPELVLDAEFRQAEELVSGTESAGSVWTSQDRYGNTFASGMVLGVKYRPKDSTGYCAMEAEVAAKVSSGWESMIPGYVGGGVYSPGDGRSDCLGYLAPIYPGDTTIRRTEYDWAAAGGPVRFRFAVGFSRPDGEGYWVMKKAWFGPSFPPGIALDWKSPVYDWGETTEKPPGSVPGPNDYKVSPPEREDLIDAIKADPEYDESWAKPWLREDFLAPTVSSEREAYWGPVVGTWVTPGGGECKEYESGAKICDSPGGTTFVWIVEDRAMWMQSSGDGGGKDWIIRPPNLSSGGGGVSDGGPTNTKPEEEFDDIGYLESSSIAEHVVEALNQGDERHRLPGVEPPNDAGKVREYIEATVDKVETSGKYFYYETDELGREVLSGPYYFLYTSGDYAGQYKKAYWDNKNGAIIIRDPAAQDGGTAFIPDDGEEYRKRNFRNTWYNRRTLE